MDAQKTVKLNWRGEVIEVEDKADEDERLHIPQDELNLVSLHKAQLYDACRPNLSSCDSSRHASERMRDHQEYDFALIVAGCIGGESGRYAIYKGTAEECNKEVKRFERSKYNPEGYRWNGNGTPREK